jgi:hypothetical protein
LRFSALRQPAIRGRSSFATADFSGSLFAPTPLATGHASPIFVRDSDDVPLPVQQANHDLAGNGSLD